MARVGSIGLVSVLLATGCLGKGLDGQIEVRHGTEPVTSTAFECDGSWVGVSTPCHGPSDFETLPYAAGGSEVSGSRRYELTRNVSSSGLPATIVVIAAAAPSDGETKMIAAKHTRLSDDREEVTLAYSGWIDEVDVEDRYFGSSTARFSIEFADHSSIRGQFKTEPQAD